MLQLSHVFSPFGRAAPGAMFVGQDVDYLLDELCGGHVIAVLGRSDQVVAHFLLVSLLRRVLSTGRLRTKEKKRCITHSAREGITSASRDKMIQQLGFVRVSGATHVAKTQVLQERRRRTRIETPL